MKQGPVQMAVSMVSGIVSVAMVERPESEEEPKQPIVFCDACQVEEVSKPGDICEYCERDDNEYPEVQYDEFGNAR